MTKLLAWLWGLLRGRRYNSAGTVEVVMSEPRNPNNEKTLLKRLARYVTTSYIYCMCGRPLRKAQGQRVLYCCKNCRRISRGGRANKRRIV